MLLREIKWGFVVLFLTLALSACSPGPELTESVPTNPADAAEAMVGTSDPGQGEGSVSTPLSSGGPDESGGTVPTSDTGPSPTQNTSETGQTPSLPAETAGSPGATPPPPPEPTSSPTLTAPVPPDIRIMGITTTRLEDPDRALRVAEAGAVWVRFDDFFWQDIEPIRTDPPTYNWDAVDEIALVNAAENGLNVIGLIQFTPEWAQKIEGKACGPIAAESRGAFAEFMAAAVQRYSAPPFNVLYWEIGNEPDVGFRSVPGSSGFGCWGDRQDPFFGGGEYGEMLKAVYPAVKEANPDAQVLVGGLLLDCDPLHPPETEPGSGTLKDCTPAKFLEGVLVNGGGDFFDGVSFHAYDFYYDGLGTYGNVNWQSGYNFSGEEPVVLAKTRYLKALLSQYRHPEKYLINSETALLCLEAGRTTFCKERDFLDLKAAYVVQSHATGFSLGLRANLWYALDADWRSTNLVGAAEQAFRNSVQMYEGAAYLGRVEGFTGLTGFRFVRENQEIWVIWSDDFEPHRIDLPSLPISMFDMLGEPLPLSDSIEITLYPLFLVWE